jgi:hypothetical protein
MLGFGLPVIFVSPFLAVLGGPGYLAVGLCVVLLILIIVLSVIFLLLQLVTVVYQMLLRARRFGFGGESIADNWFNDIYVSDTPTDVSCSTYSTTASSDLGLRHSSFYKEPKIMGVIAQWIINTVHSAAHS